MPAVADVAADGAGLHPVGGEGLGEGAIFGLPNFISAVTCQTSYGVVTRG